jgi:prolyl-tRNA editing enzyme YbaK/EbsC (Cys-tRNA(Pro) deacylase)
MIEFQLKREPNIGDSMALKEVLSYFSELNMEDRVLELASTTATVPDASLAHGVPPGQIGKTLSFKIDSEPILIVVAGDAKISNKKYKARFSAKARMLNADEVAEHTGHPVGGVCPFGLPGEIAVYLDISLKRFDEVIPAAGSHNSSIKLSLDELERYSNAQGWIDVCEIRGEI